MDLMTAFTAMLGDVTHVNASRRQVTGILAWQDLTRRAAGLAGSLTGAGRGLQVSFSSSGTHRTWRMSGQLILGALRDQMDEAAIQRARADLAAQDSDRAADAEEAAAAAAASEAAAARQRAASCLAAAAASTADGERAALQAAAAAAAAEAEAADATAARLAAAAREHREEARLARQRSAQLLGWQIAAQDAHGHGTRVIAGEEPIAAAMHAGIQAAGGISEVPGDKRYLTRDGALAPAGVGTR
jgi:hypothetical protein